MKRTTPTRAIDATGTKDLQVCTPHYYSRALDLHGVSLMPSLLSGGDDQPARPLSPPGRVVRREPQASLARSCLVLSTPHHPTTTPHPRLPGSRRSSAPSAWTMMSVCCRQSVRPARCAWNCSGISAATVVQSKQVAQQDAERAKFIVMKVRAAPPHSPPLSPNPPANPPLNPRTSGLPAPRAPGLTTLPPPPLHPPRSPPTHTPHRSAIRHPLHPLTQPTHPHPPS